ncbi:MAG TPA: hypothetical protein VHB97_04030 [Polyangia bacterium]|nr:hypothetical protein [Polyangia bacterium]
MRAARPTRLCLLLIALTASSSAYAQREGGDVGAAARAFQRGQHAQLHDEFARAASLFELADEAAPSAAALRSAIRNWDAAGNPARAATLAQRALERYPRDIATVRLAADLLTKRTRSLGSLRAHCAPACVLVVDGRSTAPAPLVDHDIYVAPGERVVAVEFEDGRSAHHRLHFAAGEKRELSLAAPVDVARRHAPASAATSDAGATSGDDDDMPPIDDSQWNAQATTAAPSARPAPEAARVPTPPTPVAATVDLARGPELKVDRRAPPIVPVVGIGLTLGLGAVLVWSYTDTLSARDRYVAHPTAAGYHDGLGRESRTYGLLGGVAVLGVTTLAVALFATNWHASFASRASSATKLARRIWPTGGFSGTAWTAGIGATLE